MSMKTSFDISTYIPNQTTKNNVILNRYIVHVQSSQSHVCNDVTCFATE